MLHLPLAGPRRRKRGKLLAVTTQPERRMLLDTAANLLASFSDLDGIVAAAADPGAALGTSVRAKILAAADYLTVARAVVNVVRDLDLPAFAARIRSSTPDQVAELERLTAEWGLGASLTRAREALAARIRS